MCDDSNLSQTHTRFPDVDIKKSPNRCDRNIQHQTHGLWTQFMCVTRNAKYLYNSEGKGYIIYIWY